MQRGAKKQSYLRVKLRRLILLQLRKKFIKGVYKSFFFPPQYIQTCQFTAIIGLDSSGNIREALT